jgi:hypothetical protein
VRANSTPRLSVEFAHRMSHWEGADYIPLKSSPIEDIKD